VELSLERPTFSRPTLAWGRIRLRILIALAILAALLAGSYFAVRGSSLVAVDQVKVVGLDGHYDTAARRAVITAAKSMTTMQFDQSRVEEAASEFVDVAAVETKIDYPHGVTIRFDVRRPVVVARVGGRTVTLSQTGEVLDPSRAVPGLVKIDVPGAVKGSRVISPRANEAAAVLGAAPDVLLRKAESVHWGKLGIVVQMKNGPKLYFGDRSHAERKWTDAVAVLANPASRGAAYLDLRVPGRVAVGGLGGAKLPQGASAATGAAVIATPTTTQAAPATSTTPEPATTTPAQPQQTTTTPTAPAQTQQPPAAAGGAAPAQ
jgi:cell division septal protein FtsQ